MNEVKSSDYVRYFGKCILLHREIQILGKLFNEMHSRGMVVFLFCAMVAQLVPVTQLLQQAASHKTDTRESDSAQFGAKMFFMVLLNNGISCMSLYIFAGDIHETSKTALKKIKYTVVMKTPKIYSRYIKSLPIVRAKFGSTNFVEKLSPVVFQHFTVARIIDVLLLSKGNNKC